ncbi:MAG TPA: hypothetical protein VK756_07680 [Solirubrobacteraceae bacterium]|nr:hypothetical protein [Solirubrobacteraceae bacterium]
MTAAPQLCSTPGCWNLVPSGKCSECASDRRREERARRASPADLGYDSRWRRTAGRFLKYHPQCECDDCLKLPRERRAKATEVHHRDGCGPLGPAGHKWFNLRAMAGEHHSKETAKQQPGGWNG